MAVQFQRQTVVWLEIAGNDDGDFPRLPSDPDNVMGRLRVWMIENEIWPAIRTGTFGPTFFHGGYTPEDALKIEKFLVSIGAIEP